MSEPIQLEFDIDDDVPGDPGDRVLYVGNISHWAGRIGTVDSIHQRVAYVQFDEDIVVTACSLHTLRRLTKQAVASE